MREKYDETLQYFSRLPEYNRVMAEDRFLLLREFEEYFSIEEQRRLGNDFMVTSARKRFCAGKGISLSSFLRWRRLELERGVVGLVPNYGNLRVKDGQIVFASAESGASETPPKRSVIAIIQFDPTRPEECVRAIKEFVEKQKGIPEAIKRSALAPFNFILSFPKSHFFKPQQLSLSEEEIAQLRLYKARTHRNHWAKAAALLMAHQGRSVFEIVVAVGRAKSTIYRWFRFFREQRLGFIETTLNEAGRKRLWDERKTRVIDILHTPPKDFNINRTSWTYDTIIQAYGDTWGVCLPKGALKRIIKETKYTWRHARQVLTSTDPDYQKKVAKVVVCLHNTKENEAFFFVDELGPYRVKKYGGKALVEKDTTRTIPARQKDKGRVQAIAALEAYTNQLTWKFIKNKDADAVVVLLEMLRDKYPAKKRLFITWDTLSTHRAGSIKSWIRRNNIAAKKRGAGPAFRVVPLPAKSQFLNVIESVFGGMKRAVIHNSDYSSKAEMEAAIDRHFTERNIYFRKNPRRAGNKIWDREAFDPDKLRGGLFRKM